MWTIISVYLLFILLPLAAVVIPLWYLLPAPTFERLYRGAMRVLLVAFQLCLVVAGFSVLAMICLAIARSGGGA